MMAKKKKQNSENANEIHKLMKELAKEELSTTAKARSLRRRLRALGHYLSKEGEELPKKKKGKAEKRDKKKRDKKSSKVKAKAKKRSKVVDDDDDEEYED